MGIKKLNLICLPLASQPKPGAIVPNDDIEQLRDAVLVYKDTYKLFFGPKTSNQRNYWKPQIVKISYGDRCIYRRLLVSSIKGLNSKTIGITYSSIGELTNCSKNGINTSPNNDVVTISRGCRWAYWRRHPNPAARISYILGIFSIALGILSIVLSLTLHFCDKF
jgi:hypothetical protein